LLGTLFYLVAKVQAVNGEVVGVATKSGQNEQVENSTDMIC